MELKENHSKLKHRVVSTLKAKNYFIKEILAFLFLLLAVFFFRKERTELDQARTLLKNAIPIYVVIGVILTAVYIMLHGFMYVFSFRAAKSDLPLTEGVKLFLKRNLVSIFLPAGGITSLTLFTSDIEKRGISKTKIGFASYIFGTIGITSLAIVALPVMIYMGVSRTTSSSSWLALFALIIIILLLVYATNSLLKGGWVYRRLYKISPQFERIIGELKSGSLSIKHVFITLLCSIGVELCGILHLYIAMKGLGLNTSLEISTIGYIVATLFYAISPFLRGLGAVEVSLIYVLRGFGINEIDSISVTVFYRIFEFWLPMLAGVFAFIFSKKNILLRILPACLLFFLGIVNIISVVTPPKTHRLKLLENFFSMGAIHFSNLSILIAGILLLICAAFLIRGFKNAYKIALLLCLISFFGNLFKAIDYEEASIALFTMIILIMTRNSYVIKSDPKVQSFGIQSSLIVLFSVIVYGVIGFYFLDKKEFGIDFSIAQASKSTLQSFFLLDPSPLPKTMFAKGYIHSINLLGILSISLLVYALIKPYIFRQNNLEEEREKASILLEEYGRSSDDYFKVYADKLFYFGITVSGFISYKIGSHFAFVLGEPVCENDSLIKKTLIQEFEQFCKNNGLISSYYRIDSDALSIFDALNKKALPIGQEAIVDISSFSLEGKDKKSLRNILNSLQKKGFFTKTYSPPIKDGLLQKLKYVSDDWLLSLGRKEILFSSGKFDWNELRNQEIITLENQDEKVVGFLNIIRDYTPLEGTYDIIRKSEDAPAGVMDALIVALISNLSSQGIERLNMGMASMSGIGKPKDLPEWAIKFAYTRLKPFKHYHGIFEFKDKFNPTWKIKYLIYDNQYELTQLPQALSKVMRDS